MITRAMKRWRITLFDKQQKFGPIDIGGTSEGDAILQVMYKLAAENNWTPSLNVKFVATPLRRKR